MVAACLLAVRPAGASNCGAIDPNGELAGITGDFELTADPDDPQGGVLFVSNTTGGTLATQNVVVAQLDGMTGTVIPNTLTTVANNYYGNSSFNGPEWFRTPQGNLGIVYAGDGGVHLALRPPSSQMWNAFQYDYSGAPTLGSPPPLPNTQPGAYASPPNQPPAEESFYAGYKGGCTSLCFANYQGGLATDVGQVLSAQGYAMRSAAPSPWDGYIYYSACKTATGACGIFTAAIDGQGGLSEQTLVARTGTQASLQVAAYRHPVTGVVVVFANAGAGAIAVWTHPSPAAQMAPVTDASVPIGADHFRAAASATQVVLNFLIKSAQSSKSSTQSTPGSYTIAVSAAADGTLYAEPAQFISAHGAGSELDWYPAAGSWRIVYRESAGYVGCWVTP
ncbi:MAG: hypothetical protein JSR21_16155 [Proteobacteria bacterium]|nr:hypothetical protein [Pseudomonadota bacterium]